MYPLAVFLPGGLRGQEPGDCVYGSGTEFGHD